MKLTKKLEAEILKTYNVYWDAYLAGDMKTFASLLDDNIKVFGTAVSEVFNNKTEAVRFYKATAHQMTGKAEFRNRKIKMFTVDETVLIHEQNNLFVLIENEWNFYGPARVSALLVKTPKGWKLAHQHGSFPDSRTEAGEQIAPEKIKKENLELREAIKRRTFELEEKNRELEIETSLEKVRAVALGMKKPEDMLEICKTISKQLQKLGVKEIRNVQTAIFYESRGSYMNYEYYAKHDKKFITDVDFKNHKIQSAFAKKMMKGTNEEVREHLKGKKLIDWYAYQKTTNQFADKYLLKAESLNYYWYSLGPVALGISTYYPLAKEEEDLFKRFLKVFELAYRRYLDIEKAETQAREAQIEASLEKVRAAATSMHKPEDLLNVCQILFKEFKTLGFDSLRNAMINIHDDEKRSFINYDYSDTIGRSTNHLFYDVHPLVEKQIKKIRSANDAFSETYFTGKDLVNWKKFRKRIGEKDDPRLDKKKGLFYYFYSIGIGSIGISTFGSIDEDQKALLKRFRNVFALSYQRYMDIAKAEAQAREAQIEAALERVRSRSMAMYNSADLSLVVYEMFTELVKLDAQLDRCIIMIVDPETLGINWYLTGKEGLLSNNGFFVQNNSHPSHQAYLDGWRTKRKKWQYNLAGEEKKNWDKFGFSKTGLSQLPEFIKADMSAIESIHLTISSDDFGCLIASSLSPLSEVHASIVDRFTTVFNQTYTRFLDLQKAEAQNKIIKAENERKTRELEEARELQLAMLPKEIPQLKDFDIAVYMKTATEVGGDYYDFSFMNNGSLNIAIGDATGHGMKAGTMVTMIKSLFMVNSSSKEMTEFFKLTNEAIKNSNLRRMMVGFAMMNIYGNKLKVLNAGMPPVYYYKNASCEVVEIGGHNLPLGAMNKSKYTADETDMKHGDVILMLSDGFTELPNIKNEQYGYKKLVDTFLQAGSRSADEIINLLKDEVSNWAGNKELEDDVTFVVVKVK